MIIAMRSYIPLRFNTTSSMPIGLYKVTNNTVTRGCIVSVCLPKTIAYFGLERHYLLQGSCENGVEPIIKKVIAMTSDKVDLNRKYIRVNGKVLAHSQTFVTDHTGDMLPAIERRIYTLPAHRVWLMGMNDERSWDSRYFGAIDEKYIQHVLVPLFTSRSKGE